MPARRASVFIKDERGTVFVEFLIVFPVLTFLCLGFFEFANILWERQQMQVGLRDAARYWSRCRTEISGASTECTADIARNIAFYGNPAGSGRLRVPGWDEPAEISFDPEQDELPNRAVLPGEPPVRPLVTVSGSVGYSGLPFFSTLLDRSITIRHSVQMRYIGW